MKKKTILHTIETSGPGGAENVLLALASAFQTEEYRSVVLLNHDGWLKKQLEAVGIPHIQVDSGAWYRFELPRAMAEFMRREKVDLVHSHLPDQNFYSSVTGWFTGRPAIVTYHGPVELADAHQIRGKIKLWAVRKAATAVVVVCDYVGQLLESIGFSSRKLVRIYNGIDTVKYSPGPGTGLRCELGLAENTKIVGTVANIRGTKGHEFFVRAAKLVADREEDVVFVVAGDIHKELGPPVQRLIHELGLDVRFKLLGFRSDVPQLLRQLDVFVLPSTSEGFPLVVLEAMAAGCPVVSTDCGGTREVVDNGRTGLLVPPADSDALAIAIGDLLASDTLRSTFARSSRSEVETNFSVEAMLDQYARLYHAVLRGQPVCTAVGALSSRTSPCA